MSAVVDAVRSLWVPLEGTNLLVPNVAIAEVINYQPFEALHEEPDWLLGALRWRDTRIPVVSMERLLGYGIAARERGARIAVLNTVRADSGPGFYAIVTSAIPRLIIADQDALGEALEAGEACADTVACRIRIGSEEALIPDMQAIQSLIDQSWR